MDESYTPDPGQVSLMPDVSGNTMNGVGEDDVRRPTPIYWHDPDTLPHGPLMRWYWAKNSDPEVLASRDRVFEILAQPLPEIAPGRVERSAADWTAAIKDAALSLHADQVGITALRPEWVFDGYDIPYRWIIVLAVRMDYEPLSQAPGPVTSVEVMDKYGEGARAAKALAGWIRDRGWDALPHGGPQSGPVLLIPHAIEAGLGELGKHGSMISREFGSSFRLSCVMTDLPLIPDAAAPFGADDFCRACRVCEQACPPVATAPDKQRVRGETKWYVDFDKCVLYFNENESCGICLAVCPWSRPGVAPRLAEKMARRREAG
ncbi:MAG: reductive dehalogenase domain-containing protein [Bauldia litoralis]